MCKRVLEVTEPAKVGKELCGVGKSKLLWSTGRAELVCGGVIGAHLASPNSFDLNAEKHCTLLARNPF